MRYRRNFIVASFVWTAIVFNFFLLSFYFKYFPGSIFINTTLIAVADMVSYLVSGLLLKCLNTNKALILAQTISATGAILYFFLYENAVAIPFVIIMSRIGNSMSFNTMYVTNNRLFPVYFLASSFGLLNFISHLVGVGAPMVAEVADPLPFAVFLANAVIALIASLFLKELFHGAPSGVVKH